MTTAKKLWLGFGTLLTLLAISSLLNFVWLSGIQSRMTEIADVAEPIREAAFEMEVNINATGMGVLQYLDTGTPRYRVGVAQDKDDFLTAKGRYDRLTTNPDQSKRLGDLYERYHGLGVSLMENRDHQQAMFLALSRSAKLAEDHLNKEIRSQIDREGLDGHSKVEEAVTMKAHAASIGSWLGHYRRTGDSDYDRRLDRHQHQLGESLTRFRKLRLSDQEKEWASKLEVQFQDMTAQVARWLNLHKTHQANLEKCFGLQTQLGGLLNKEIQVQAGRDLMAAKTAAENNVHAVIAIMAATLLGCLALGSLVSLLISRDTVKTEASLRVSLASIGDAVVLTDTDGKVTFLNRVAESLTGWSPNEAAGKPLSTVVALINETTRQPIGDPVLDMKESGVRIAIAYHPLLVARDGAERPIEDNAAPIRDEQGNFLGVAMIFRDITERRQVERERERIAEALRESGEWLQQLANAMPQIVFSALPDGTFDYFNLRWYEFTASQEGERCQGWKPVLHPDDLPTWQDRWAEAIREGKSYQLECRLKNKRTGDYRWHLCRALPVRNRAGAILRWYGTCTDIDRQKRNEEALMVADRRKDEFLAVLSHELRNPLAPIRNALHMLRLGTFDDPDMTEARDVIDRQVTQLAGIVDDLLDVFRVLHHKMAIHTEALDLAHLVRQTVEDHRSGVEVTRRTLTMDVPDKPLWVEGDRRRLGQVVANLLSNAVKYTNSGDDVSIRVAADDLNRCAIVSVRDTGIGIERQLLPHVFETFIQGEQSLDRREGGLGLGLPLVKGIVELHGGAVRADSAGLGQGTEITFWLPQSQQPGAAPHDPCPIASARHLRILIIEDNADAARTLAKLLKRYGHVVEMAHDGVAGLEAARSGKPEVVLCDLGLPEMDGYEVARALRTDPATESIRLIAVSGYGQDEDRRHSEEAGFDLHLTKPVDPVELQRLLTVLKVGP